jgi:hypothetical protein
VTKSVLGFDKIGAGLQAGCDRIGVRCGGCDRIGVRLRESCFKGPNSRSGPEVGGIDGEKLVLRTGGVTKSVSAWT